MYTPDPSTMAHSADQSPPLMTQDLPLSVVDRSPRDFPKPPVHVTLPPTARTTTRQKSPPSSQAQSPITSEGQLLALDNFFGPAPQRQRSVDLEKQNSEPRNIFAPEKEPETVSKYLFYYGFGTHIPGRTSAECLSSYSPQCSPLSGFSGLVFYLWLPARFRTQDLRQPRLERPAIQDHQCSAKEAQGGVGVYFRCICKLPSAGGVFGACTPGSLS
ncbi:unnamed protein product [Rhizoctonia solani]|uniref:Uncharacterized protein n=1 Tax=Rhizoctonia solani TaxID=456999 RepID=A0A8H3A258_9AGAM|nr:unnamed protein product [Rhizoctonia solani]